MVNFVTSAVACVSVWYKATPPVFCHAATDFGVKRRRASLLKRFLAGIYSGYSAALVRFLSG